MMDSSLPDSTGAETAQEAGDMREAVPTGYWIAATPVVPEPATTSPPAEPDRFSNVGRISGNPNLAHGGRVHILFPPCLVV